jgi:glycosyl-4,4'-diaponeurosporenoate acyltransferase
LFEVSRFWLIFLNVSMILLIHMGISFLCNKIPLARFDPGSFLYRIRGFEDNPKFYVQKIKIKKWKKIIPDGAKLFKNAFRKQRLANCDNDYLHTFMLETCRAELTHWLQMTPFFVFFIWNPWWSALIMCLYLLLANIPCILLQRHNRYRLLKILGNKI